MNVSIVIPARYGSSRFPGKPLAPIAGRSLIERVWQIASQVTGVGDLLVATDDQRIFTRVESFGGRAVMTPAECRNGTERVYAAVEAASLIPDIIVNFQGDSVLTPPAVLQSLVDHMANSPQSEIATPAVPLSRIQYDQMKKLSQQGKAGGTLVTFDRAGKAMYFSKAIIPHLRDGIPKELPVYKHLGIYAYRFETLKRYLSLEPGRFEQVEKLEQLRALEHGIPIDVVQVDFQGRTGWSVDLPEDVQIVEEIIAQEGEVVGNPLSSLPS